MDFAATRSQHVRGTPFIGAGSPYYAGPDGHISARSWRGTRQREGKCGRSKEPYPAWSGALVTAGDVVFYGTLDGWFKAIDAKTGEVLWKFKVGSGVVGNPITFRGPTGSSMWRCTPAFGGDWGLLSGRRSLRRPGGRARRRPDFMKDIGRHTSQGGIVWIFGL